MNKTEATKTEATETEADTAPLAPPPHRRSGGRRFLLVILAIAVFGTLIYLLSIPARHELARLTAAPAPAPAPADDPRIATLTDQVDQLRTRLATLEQRVASLPVGPSGPQPVPMPVPAPVIPLAGTDPIVTALATRMDALGARQDRMDAQMVGQASELKADADRLEAAANQAAAVATLTDRTTRMGHVQAAEAALAAGLPLGEFPGAPPAVLRFQAESPPTEAALRLAFPAAAKKARAAARPETHGLGFWQGLWARAGSLVTIRRGDTVVIGSQQIGTIDRARAALDAGDLPGTVAILNQLAAGPAAAFAGWRAQAQSLLDARAALATLASHS